MYISEISLPGIRGCLSAMLKVLGNVGVLLSYIAGSYLNWRQSALLVAIAPSMLFLGTLFIPETPSYLVLNGKDEEAASSLQWLRGPLVDIRHELQVSVQSPPAPPLCAMRCSAPQDELYGYANSRAYLFLLGALARSLRLYSGLPDDGFRVAAAAGGVICVLAGLCDC